MKHERIPQENMEEARKRLGPTGGSLSEQDYSALLQLAQSTYPEILTLNLTRKTYRILQYDGSTTVGTPPEGPIEQMLEMRLPFVAEEDQQAFRDTFFPEPMYRAIQKGRERFSLTYRRTGQPGVWHWSKTMAMRLRNPYDDDLLVVAFSRNADKEKEEEMVLRKAVENASQELEDWLYYNNLSKQNFPGLVYVEVGEDENHYTVGRLAERLGCNPRCLALGKSECIPPEDRDKLAQARAEALAAGETAYHAKYRVNTEYGESAWVSNQAMQFRDKLGELSWIHFLTDITREHALTEQLRRYMEEQIRESEEVFRIVAEHSNRILYHYDLATGTTRPWDTKNQKKDILAHLYKGNYTDDRLKENRFVLPESREEVQRFFTEIYSGKPTGEANVHIELLDGQRRWFHFRYSSIFSGGKPKTALMSIEDVTERHEHEMAYRRHVQSIEATADGQLLYMESDLTADRVELLAGRLIGQERREVVSSHENFDRWLANEQFAFEKAQESADYFARTHLLQLYAQGERSLVSEWKIRFLNDREGWVEIETTLMADPYNGHIRAFIRMKDVSEERKAHLAAIQRADFDTMTGLLRKDVGEERVAQQIAQGQPPGGVLIVLDLDDLKGINDNLGHKQGDIAITSIAQELKAHFRREDILVRAGGDEFLVYLPGAAQSAEAVEKAMEDLLRSLAGVTVGTNGERVIRCSAGCAAEEPVDTFDSLFQRADMALYYVKRHGKNNFAFYEPEMVQADYQFKVGRMTAVTARDTRREELQCLLEAVAMQFPGVVLLNLSRDRFHILSTGGHVDKLPASDQVDLFWTDWRERIHPEDRETTLALFSRKSLLSMYDQGQRAIRHYFRSEGGEGYVRTEAMGNLFQSKAGDVCAVLFLRWHFGQKKEPAGYLAMGTVRGENQQPVEEVLLRCLSILSREQEPEDGVDQLLETVCSYYEADRAYIFEFDYEGGIINNTFEWCRPGVAAEIDNLQEIPAEVVDRWVYKFETVGEFFISSLRTEIDPSSEEYQILQDQGIQSLMAAPLRRDGKLIGFVGVDDPSRGFGDLTLLRAVCGFVLEELEKGRLVTELETMSHRDILTGLKNRRQYARILREFDHHTPKTLGVITLDINGLKEINEVHGYEYGDYVIKQTARVLKEQFREGLYRVGGDEFVVLCRNLDRAEFQIKTVSLRRAMDAEKSCNVSVGCAWSGEEINVNTLLQQADEMRHAEKQSYYHTILTEGRHISRTGLVEEVLQEIEHARFEVHYQPQVDIRTGKVVGAEALVRKLDEDGNLIPPGMFIPFYEMGGVISHVDLFVFRTACRGLRRWLDQGYDLHVSVNFSRVTLLEPHIVSLLGRICREAGVPASAVIIEVTESVGKMDADQLQGLIRALKGAGFRVSLDDFGSEYSNLAILADLDFDEVKFDRTLVSALEENEKSRVVMKNSMYMCRDLQGTVSLAEGIETQGQLDLLMDYNCDYGQGYFFSRPVSLHEFEEYLKRFR